MEIRAIADGFDQHLEQRGGRVPDGDAMLAYQLGPVGGLSLESRFGNTHPGERDEVGIDRLRLVGPHQRTAPRVAENDDLLDPGFLVEPAYADADVDQRVLEQEVGFSAAKRVFHPRNP